MTNNLRRNLAVLLGVTAGFSTASVCAQQQDLYLEEIVVTAQKREQNLQEVPVAVTAYTGDMLQDSGIKDIRELAAIAPTLRSNTSQNSTTASFGIRGIGTSSQNWGLESSVGIYVDGVYRSRQSAIINNLADIESIEVLRGPQGTLFGKNTPSGALNIRTVRPSHETNAFVEVTAGDYGLLNVNAASNVSIVDNILAARATVFSGQRDGVISDLGFGSDKLNDRDRLGGRLQLFYTPNDRFDMRIIADYAEIDEVCCAALPRFNNFAGFGGAPGTDAFLAAPAPFGLGVPIITAAQFDDYVTALTELPRSTNEDSGLSVEFNYDFENVTLTSITAYRAFDSTDFIDADFSAADLLFDQNLSEQSSISQELRLTGEFGDGGNYVIGAYYFTQDLDNFSTLTLGEDTNAFFSLDPLLGAATAGVNSLEPLSAFGLPYQLAAPSFPDMAFATDDMRQEHDSVAVFAQADFPLSDNVTLTAGLRYTDEQKEMAYDFLNSPLGPPPDFAAITAVLTGVQIWSIDPMLPGALDPTNPANVPTVLAALGPTYVPGWGIYTQPSLAPQAGGIEKLDDDQVTGTLKLSWFVNDDILLYASYGTGYKSGGTNTDRINPVFSQTFGAETSTAIEIGMKADFPDQNVRLNVALHDTEVEDLQTNAFSGNGFNLQNAGIADTYGAEVELLWLPTDSLDIQLSYAYNVADLKNFQNGTCWVATPFFTGQPDPGQPDPLLPVCDRSGGRVPANPEHNLYLGLQQDFQMGASTLGFIRAEYTHLSDTMTDGNNDPLKLRKAFDNVNLRLGVVFEDFDAEVAVWARNLTDERFYETVFDVPVQDGKLMAYPHDPRTWGVSFRKNFN